MKKFLLLLIIPFLSFGQSTNYSISFENCNSDDNIDESGPHINFGDILDMPSSFSICTWVYANCNQHGAIISKAYEGQGFQLGLDKNLNNSEGGFGFSVSGENITTPSIYENEWVFLSAVFDSGYSLKLYVNGNLVSSLPVQINGIIDNNFPFLIGSMPSS